MRLNIAFLAALDLVSDLRIVGFVFIQDIRHFVHVVVEVRVGQHRGGRSLQLLIFALKLGDL